MSNSILLQSKSQVHIFLTPMEVRTFEGELHVFLMEIVECLKTIPIKAKCILPQVILPSVYWAQCTLMLWNFTILFDYQLC
jgi:hypothetical protein